MGPWGLCSNPPRNPRKVWKIPAKLRKHQNIDVEENRNRGCFHSSVTQTKGFGCRGDTFERVKGLLWHLTWVPWGVWTQPPGPHIGPYLLVSVTDGRISLLFDNFQKKSKITAPYIILAPGGVDQEEVDGQSDADDNDHHPNHYLQYHHHHHTYHLLGKIYSNCSSPDIL